MTDDGWNDPGRKEAAEEHRKQREHNGGNGRDQQAKRRSQADALLELALVAELFLAPDGTGYADVIVHGHRET